MPRCHPLRRTRSLAAAAAVATTVLGVLAGAPAAGAAVPTQTPAGANVQLSTAFGAHTFQLPGMQTQVRAGTSPDGAVQIKVPGLGCRRRQAVEPFIRWSWRHPPEMLQGQVRPP